MLEELIDRFGEPPKAVLNLLAIARLKALAHQGYITEIKQMQREDQDHPLRKCTSEPGRNSAAGCQVPQTAAV